MLTANDAARAFLGIDAWHKAGYTGKGMVIGTGEPFDVCGTHGWKVMRVIQEVAPDAEIVYIPTTYTKNELVTFAPADAALFADKCVSAWTISLVRRRPDPAASALFDGILKSCTLFTAIGNDYEDAPVSLALDERFIGVGAFFIDGVGNITPETFSSESEHLDFSCWDRWQVAEGEPGTKGTSFGSPALTGMTALVNQFFLEKTGHVLSAQEMYNFLKDCAVDFHTAGQDSKTGWGYVRLPDPNSIDITKYTQEVANVAEFPDIDGHWAQDEITYCVNMGLFKGRDDGLFHPDDKVTRAEICAILARYIQQEE